jgi:hypothetical protein
LIRTGTHSHPSDSRSTVPNMLQTVKQPHPLDHNPTAPRPSSFFRTATAARPASAAAAIAGHRIVYRPSTKFIPMGPTRRGRTGERHGWVLTGQRAVVDSDHDTRRPCGGVASTESDAEEGITGDTPKGEAWTPTGGGAQRGAEGGIQRELPPRVEEPQFAPSPSHEFTAARSSRFLVRFG